MDSIIRAALTYSILFILFRFSGKRTLGESSPFDLVLLLIISEAAQEALVDGDYSITNMVIVVSSLLLMDIGISLLKEKNKKVARIIDGVPLMLIINGEKQEQNMKKSRVSEEDILEHARESQGIGTLEEIRHAILETNGRVSIIPAEKE